MAPSNKVVVIGSGNWGSCISRMIGENVKKYPEEFDQEVQMWVFQEKVNGRNLTDIINEDHENVKYLPGHKLPDNVIANPDLVSSVKGANTLVFVTPHQFVEDICDKLKDVIPKENCRAITLVKGVDVNKDRIRIFADVIQEKLNVRCSALSGANVANEVAEGKFCETTIGYRTKEDGELFKRLFQTPMFQVQLIDDVDGVSLCGALKNIVAIAAGLCDGLGHGTNTKSAIIRIGLLDMRNFAKEYFPNIQSQTFLEESAGVADVITSCFGGRNRKVAEAFVKTRKPFEQLEDEMLGGQKLQGTSTAEDVNKFLKARGEEDKYPLFKIVYEIAFKGMDPKQLTHQLSEEWQTLFGSH
ncbi:NAD-dependent glycerol-3-phosphate dehydrogenase [Cystobasidium minutum MCA 4210]|uniref:NAD-dependent glycerol-3-phosphate dehydrogenase n=1 Tax=Cystobasidium minutum MCA 4210 TaxID=1397322 RepID=UPI0034CDC5A9|eukprot:jgi/Rhomi1/167263/fgenesh1_kg.2_\